MGYQADTYLFGSPKVGGSKYLTAFQRLKGKHTAVRIKTDPVPKLPRSWFRKWYLAETNRFELDCFTLVNADAHLSYGEALLEADMA